MIDEILGGDEGDQRSHGWGESCDWLNILAKWTFCEGLKVPGWRQGVETVFREMLGGLRRGSYGPFVKSVSLLDLDLGSGPPAMHKARTFQVGPLTVLAADLDYAGRLVAIAQVEAIGGWQIFLRLAVDELAGPIFLVLDGQAGHLWYGLRTMDRVRVRAEVVVNGLQWSFLNWIVGRLLFVNTIRKKLVFPATKSHYLVQ